MPTDQTEPRAWLDADGRHVWVAHNCPDERVETMLPTIWKADALGNVTPSFHCTRCGLHYFATLAVERSDAG